MPLQTASHSPETLGVSPLVEKLEHFVHTETCGRVRDLRVTVCGNEIVLSGTAPSYYLKQLATHAVLGAVEGVTLENRIQVV